MRIFLIAGKAGSGKNVVAKLIKEYYIYKVEECAITSYSKYIKNFALELTDWDGTDANKPRDFMQHLGDVMRELDEDFLVSNMIKDITIYQNCSSQDPSFHPALHNIHPASVIMYLKVHLSY